MKKLVNRAFLTAVVLICCAATALASQKLIPGGNTIGVKLYTQGLVITGFEEESAAKAAGMKKGDVIVEVDGREVHSTEALRTCLAREQVVVTALRNGREAEFCIRPRERQLGAYVRDSISGIGTVTYYDPESRRFGALGHGVSGEEGSETMPVEAGVVVASSVEGIERGRAGTPGELKGKFDVHQILGEVTQNSSHGIFGTMTSPIEGKSLELAKPEDIHTGEAEIWSNIAGTQVKAYTVEILKLFPEAKESGRNLLLRVTDKELLQQTGGIVQGMSGSPIIQNGKLVGAVTHVCVRP